MISEELLAAIRDCGLALGTSRRFSARRKNQARVEDLPELVKPALGVEKIALVFGSEDKGLSMKDAGLCHWIVSIRPAANYGVFSVSHAAAIMLWEMNRLARSPKAVCRERARAAETERLLAELLSILTEIDFVAPGDPRGMMGDFRAFLSRAMLSPREVSMLRGVIRKMRWRINKAGKKP